MRPIEPTGEALQQGLHELREIVRTVSETGVDFRHPLVPALAPSFRKLLGHTRDKRIGIRRGKTFQKFFIRKPSLRHRWDFQ